MFAYQINPQNDQFKLPTSWKENIVNIYVINQTNVSRNSHEKKSRFHGFKTSHVVLRR